MHSWENAILRLPAIVIRQMFTVITSFSFMARVLQAGNLPMAVEDC